MARTHSKSKESALIRLLKRIDEGDDVRLLTKEARQVSQEIGETEMATAERHLLDCGYSAEAITHLSAAFVLMGLYEEHKNHTKSPLPDAHILQRVSAEHGIFRCLAAELSDVLVDIMATEHLSDTTSEFRRLAHIVHHLRAMKEHFDREDDVILPHLKRQGWTSLCRTVARDHAQLQAHIDNLTGLIAAFGAFAPEAFKSRLAKGVTHFCTRLSEHLSFEDGLLWPITLVVIDDPATWKTIKALSNEIGYCGIHA